MDFLIQEINRESNTIGSKSSSLDIINTVVEIKSKVEEIREQIQNIEWKIKYYRKENYYKVDCDKNGYKIGEYWIWEYGFSE